MNVFNFDNLPYPRSESQSQSGPKIIFMALLPVITLRTSRTNPCLSIVKKTLAWIRGQVWQRFLPQTVDRVSAAVQLEAHYTVVHRLYVV